MSKKNARPSADDLVNIALNAACLAVQTEVGQTDGGLAGIYFSGCYATDFATLFKPYCESELRSAEERDEEQTENPEPAIKYYLGLLSVRRGEDEQTHRVRFTTNGDPDQYLDSAAERFIDEEGANEDGGYWHEGGTTFVTPKTCREIPKDFYVACHQFGAVDPV